MLISYKLKGVATIIYFIPVVIARETLAYLSTSAQYEWYIVLWLYCRGDYHTSRWTGSGNQGGDFSAAGHDRRWYVVYYNTEYMSVKK